MSWQTQKQEILRLSREGLSQNHICAMLRIHHRKVRRALGADCKQPRRQTPEGGKMDGHRGWLLARLEQYPMINAHALFHQLVERGFEGSYSLVRQHVSRLRPTAVKAYRKLDFLPGEAAQVDWGEWGRLQVDGGTRRLSFFVMVLCHSRMLYAEMCFSQSMEFWLQAHRNAFEYFGGVPERVIVDNCKTAVIKPRKWDSEAQFNPAYLDFAGRCGFNITACAAHHPESKGRVENAVGYVKTGFLAGREALEPEVVNPVLRHWLDNTANRRKHGTTGLVPAEVYRSAEKKKMLPLPKSFPLCYRTCSAVADSQFRVTVDTNKYSVPSRAASKKVSLEIYAQRVVVKDENEALLADHRRCFGFRREVTDPEHDRAFVLASRSGSERTLLTKFLGLGSGARKFLDGLREKVPNWNDHAKQILALEQVHGREKVARALLDCTEHNAYSASYIHNMLELRGRLSPDPGPLRVARREDLLELRVEEPDMSIYGKGGGNETV